MHDMQLLMSENRFVGYRFSVKVVVGTTLSEKMQKKVDLSPVLGETILTLTTPVADIDLMLELSAKKIYQNMKAYEALIDDVTIESIIDEDGHSHESTALSALLSWLNHYDIADDAIRESVVDLSLYDQRMILTFCERHTVSNKKLEGLISYFTKNPEDALLHMASRLTSMN